MSDMQPPLELGPDTDVYKRQPEEAILFFHGGGWVTGDVDTYNRVCAVTVSYTHLDVYKRQGLY